jgi:hypothetical protein
MFDLFDLIALNSNHQVEEMSQNLLTEIAKVFLDSDSNNVIIGMISLCLKGLILHVHDPTDDAMTFAFGQSPFSFQEPTNEAAIPHLATVNSVLSFFCGPVQSRSYRIGIRLGSDGGPLYNELFQVTKKYLMKCQHTNEMIALWRRLFNAFGAEHHSSQTLLLNQLVPLYIEKTTPCHIQRLVFLRELISIRFGSAYIDAVSGMMASSDLGLGQNDIFSIIQSIDYSSEENEKLLGKLIRDNMHEVSPWDDQSYHITERHRMSLCCSDHSQPVMKRMLRVTHHESSTPSVCKLIKTGSAKNVEFSYDHESIHIGKRQIKFGDVQRLFVRNHKIEIFTKQRKGILLSFGPHDPSEVLRFPILPVDGFPGSYTQKWLDYEMTTFKYLMLLNEYSSRSFLDVSTYPVFPWVITFDGPIEHRRFGGSSQPPNAAVLKFFLGTCEPFKSLSVASKIPGQFTSMQVGWQTCGSEYELCPEFFASPEYFSENFELPEWSRDASEFVYKHRKLLESDAMSEDIPQWIDHMFGKFSPTRLFTHLHPHRKCLKRGGPFFSQTIVAIDRRPLVFAQVIEVNFPVLQFLAVAGEGKLQVLRVRVDFAARDVAISPIGELPCDVVFAGIRRGFLALDATEVFLVDQEVHRGCFDGASFRHIGSSRKLAILADHNGQLYSLRFPAIQFVGCVTNDYVSVVAVSSKFAVVVVGTCDGKVAAYGLSKGEFRFAVDVGSKPLKIVVTHRWGFVLVDAGEKLFLFDCNGKLLKVVEIRFVARLIVTFACEKGRDFFAIASTKGQIMVAEAFYLDLEEVAFTVSSKVVAMEYVMSKMALIIINRDGEVCLIPKKLPGL